MFIKNKSPHSVLSQILPIFLANVILIGLLIYEQKNQDISNYEKKKSDLDSLMKKWEQLSL